MPRQIPNNKQSSKTKNGQNNEQDNEHEPPSKNKPNQTKQSYQKSRAIGLGATRNNTIPEFAPGL